MKSQLETIGCRVSLAPLIEIAFEPIAADALAGVAGLIATSGNAIESLRRSPALTAALDLPIFAVGAATAARARDAGFQTVFVGPGTAADLAPVIAPHPAAKSGTLLHLAGDRLAVDLAALLAAVNVKVRSLVVYRSIAAATLPADVRIALEQRAVNAVILMSPRTAKIWRRLISEAPENLDISDLAHICLSRDVKISLEDVFGEMRPKVEVAAAPTREEILALVRRLASQSAAG
ncbi:MAG: uroporphyrinogen-III synthase [Hyphomicrobium sp.]